jgi:glycosyltransferase involved in cell wall biosynthesis
MIEISRICIDCRHLDSFSGIGRYISKLIEVLSDLSAMKSIQVYAIVSNQKQRQQLPATWNFLVVKLKPTNFLSWLFLGFILQKYKLNYIHFPTYSAAAWISKNTIVIMTIHDLMYREIQGFFGKSWLKNRLGNIYFDFIVSLSSKRANYLLSDSAATQASIRNWLHLQSIVFPMGVDISVFSKLKTELDEKILASTCLRQNSYFLYVGNARPQKNLQVLIDAYCASESSNKLVLAGKLQNKQISTNPKIIILDSDLDDSELAALYRSCKAYVMPSRAEGFGIPVIEAYSCGAKVICSNGGALIEFALFTHQFNPSATNELTELLKNVDLLPSKIISYRQFEQTYSWESIKRKISEFWLSIL